MTALRNDTDWLNDLAGDAEFDPQLAVEDTGSETRQDDKTRLLNALKDAIDSELTTRQWTAITAELKGMPLVQVAEKMGSNPNSLYKLLHDARRKLRRALEASGFTIDDVRSALN